MSIKSAQWKSHWDAVRSQSQQNSVIITRHSNYGNRIHVSTPFNSQFASRAKEIGGRWKKRSGVWSFEPHQTPQIIQIVKQLFGDITIKLQGFNPSRKQPEPKVRRHEPEGDCPFDLE